VVVRDERSSVRPLPAPSCAAWWRPRDRDRAPSDLRSSWPRAARRCRAAVLAMSSGRGLVAAWMAGVARIQRHGCRAVMSRTTGAGLARRASWSWRGALSLMGLDLPWIVPHPSLFPGARRSPRRRARVSFEGRDGDRPRRTRAPVGDPVELLSLRRRRRVRRSLSRLAVSRPRSAWRRRGPLRPERRDALLLLAQPEATSHRWFS
jgi:hypothetical protein